MARLSGLRFDSISTGAGLHPLTLPLHQAVLHALDIQAAVAWATFSRTFALSSNMPPVWEEMQVNVSPCVNRKQLFSMSVCVCVCVCVCVSVWVCVCLCVLMRTWLHSQRCRAQQQQQDEVNVHSVGPTPRGGHSYARTLPFVFAHLRTPHVHRDRWGKAELKSDNIWQTGHSTKYHIFPPSTSLTSFLTLGSSSHSLRSPCWSQTPQIYPLLDPTVHYDLLEAWLACFLKGNLRSLVGLRHRAKGKVLGDVIGRGHIGVARKGDLWREGWVSTFFKSRGVCKWCKRNANPNVLWHLDPCSYNKSCRTQYGSYKSHTF